MEILSSSSSVTLIIGPLLTNRTIKRVKDSYKDFAAHTNIVLILGKTFPTKVYVIHPSTYFGK